MLKYAVTNYFFDENKLSHELQGISELKNYPSKKIVHCSFFLVLERLKTFKGPPLHLPCILPKQTLLYLGCLRLLERHLEFFLTDVPIWGYCSSNSRNVWNWRRYKASANIDIACFPLIQSPPLIVDFTDTGPHILFWTNIFLAPVPLKYTPQQANKIFSRWTPSIPRRCCQTEQNSTTATS